MEAAPLSVVMITLNEERNLPRALESVRGLAKRVFIVDSRSTDRTVDVALDFGATVVQRPFTNFGDHWNWTLRHMPIDTPWTFLLAPDEQVSQQLAAEIAKVLSGSPACDGYTVPWRLWFMGKPLHVVSPNLRLFRSGRCRFSSVIVNEHPLVDGPIGRLRGYLEHHDSADLHHWWDKQNRYTTMEAIAKARDDTLSAQPRLLGSRLERRMFLKRHFYRVPFCIQLRWVHDTFVRGAFLDGRRGLEWARMRSEVSRMIGQKIAEIRQTGREPIIPRPPHGDFDTRVLATPLQQSLMSKL